VTSWVSNPGSNQLVSCHFEMKEKEKEKEMKWDWGWGWDWIID